MKERKRPVALMEAGLLTTMAIIFTMVGTFVPAMGIFLMIVAVPLALIGIRHGLKILVMAVAVATVVGIMVGGVATGISIGLMAGLAAILITYAFEHHWSVSHMTIGVAILSVLTLAISFQLSIIILGVNFFDLLDASMKNSVEMLKDFMVEQGEYEKFTESMALSVETLKMIFPTMLFTMGITYAITNILVLRFSMKRMKMTFLPSKPFNEFMYDRSVLIGTSLIMILSYLAGVMKIVDLLTLFSNVILIIAVVFSIEGLAVIDFFFARRALSKE